jgi:2-haloacid dehalogenase
MAIEVVAFDTFGTVFDLSQVDHQEIRDYAHHIRKPDWSPLHLPESWTKLPAHPDSKLGLDDLRKKYMVVTCSNGPLGLLAKLSRYNNIQWDAIIPLELNKVYKPNPKAYLTVCEVLGVEPSKVAMVTANKDFGDLEGSESVGIKPILIRGSSWIDNIIYLAKMDLDTLPNHFWEAT